MRRLARNRAFAPPLAKAANCLTGRVKGWHGRHTTIFPLQAALRLRFFHHHARDAPRAQLLIQTEIRLMFHGVPGEAKAASFEHFEETVAFCGLGQGKSKDYRGWEFEVSSALQLAVWYSRMFISCLFMSSTSS